jgi:hypothetical protein
MAKQSGEDALIARSERESHVERAEREAQLRREAEQDARIAAALQKRRSTAN